LPSEILSAMTADEFWGLFGRREHAGLDFKRGVPKGVLHTIPAMAMTDGGLIVHGVTDEREIVGCRLSQRVQDQITRYAHQCDLDVQLQSVLVDGLELTLTHAGRALQPQQSDNARAQDPRARRRVRRGRGSHVSGHGVEAAGATDI